MPDELVEAIATGQVVVFAGAGVSTESRLVAPATIFEEIASRADLDPTAVTFPAAMTAYSDRFGRPALLQQIRSRLDYVRAFPELDRLATRFHRELATVYPLEDIVTTNWDTYFEDFCGALPIVAPQDYSFWSVEGRKVFKIHGSISNWGSVVATEADYERCYRRLRAGVIGASLKHLLATKRVLFVGYSLHDNDFARIYRFLGRELGEVLPRSYIVTLDEEMEVAHPNSRVLLTSGEYFLLRLKERLVAQGVMLPDVVFGRIALKLRQVDDAHARLSEIVMRERPEVIYAHSYQDGLIHAFERILARAKTGEYSSPEHVRAVVEAYDPIRRRKLREKAYWDVAYIDGYTNGLVALLVEEDMLDALPIYYMFGAGELLTYDDYVSAADHASDLHKTAYRIACRLAARYHDDTTVLHHTPWLA
jgi:NAD-dependent SIR2 family protein deacetylase